LSDAYGSDAWTAKHSANSNEKEFTEETGFEATQGVATNPGGYQKMLEDHKHHSKPIKGWTRDMYPALSQTNNRDEADGKSEWTDYVHGSDAWTAKHSKNSNEKEFNEETGFEATQGVATNPGGYQKMLEDHKHHSKPIKGWTRDMYPALA
jgi:hypothetical protein